MSIRHICDCCGKGMGRTLCSYRLVAPLTTDNLEICRECFYRIRRECFYRIRDEITKENETQDERNDKE